MPKNETVKSKTPKEEKKPAQKDTAKKKSSTKKDASNSKAKPAVESKVEERTEIKSEAKTEVKAEPNTEVKDEPKTEVKDEPSAEPKTEVKSEPSTEPKTEVKSEPSTEPNTEVKDEPKTEVKAQPKAELFNKKLHSEIMTTGSYIRAFLLMLIPGINIICILFWALGAAKNKNKVHFSRACIVLFLVEIILTAIILGGTYIYADIREPQILEWIDKKTDGLITYFEIDKYSELTELKNIGDYLVIKDDNKEDVPVVVPKTRVVENPDEIKSFGEFLKLYEAQYGVSSTEVQTGSENDTTTTVSSSESTSEPAKNNATEPNVETTTKTTTTPVQSTLNEILISHNVDITKSGYVYIIIDNEYTNCIIAFSPTGKTEGAPSLRLDNNIIYVGGTK